VTLWKSDHLCFEFCSICITIFIKITHKCKYKKLHITNHIYTSAQITRNSLVLRSVFIIWCFDKVFQIGSQNHRIAEVGKELKDHQIQPQPNHTTLTNNPPLRHVPEHHIQTVFKHIQGWWLNHLPGQSIPVLNNPFCKEQFPDIQPELTLVQLEAISPRPVTCHQWEETNVNITSFMFTSHSDR